MKKITMALATLALVAAMILPASAAEVNAPIGYAMNHSTECALGTPIQAYSLEEMDQMAVEAGYVIDKPVAKDALRMYTARVDGMSYHVTLFDQMVTKCSHQDGSEIGGAICAMPLYVDENLVATEFDPRTTLFNDVISMDAVETKLSEAGYSISEPVPGVTQYLKGNDIEGSSITVIGDTVRIYNYGENYGELMEYVIVSNAVPIDLLASVK